MMLRETLRAALVIARRDFRATVMSKSFIFFLLAPLFPLAIGLLFANLGERIERTATPPLLAVSLPEADAALFVRAHRALQPLLGVEGQPPMVLEMVAPGADPVAQRRALVERKKRPVIGVLDGSIAAPRFTGAVQRDGPTLTSVRVLVDEARRMAAGASAEPTPGIPLFFESIERSSRSLERGRELTARAGQALQFLLTLLLAGMLLSQLVEEKSNKVIEVLAAAVPIDSIFLGKLFAMLSVSLVGIAVWGTAGVFAISTWLPGGLGALPAPAVGWPAFATLGVVYFAMSYLILGAAFLGIGAQATTVREVQTLSMPVTMSQMLIFALCTAAVSKPYSEEGIAAALIPFSSPFAMLARAAEEPTAWIHVAALVWQACWVVIILKVSSRVFSRTVLKSGPRPRRRWWRRAA